MNLLKRTTKEAPSILTGPKDIATVIVSVNGATGPRTATSSDLLNNFAGTVYRCATLNAQSVSSNPWGVFAKARTTKVYSYREVSKSQFKQLSNKYSIKAPDEVIALEDHPLSALLKRPNPETTGVDFFELIQTFLELCGDAYILKEVNGRGTPIALYLLYPQWITPQFDPATGRVNAYRYSPGGSTQNYTPEEVIHIMNPNPRSQVTGLSPLEASLGESEFTKAVIAYQLNLLNNGGRPDGLLKVPKGTQEDTKKRLLAQFISKFKGFAKTGQPVVLEEDMDYKPISHSPADMIILETGKYSQDVIRNCFGIPESYFNSSSNKAEALIQQSNYARDTILPRLTRLEATINEQIVPLFDPSGRVIFSFENPIPSDEEARLREIEVYSKTGYMSINELRACEGLDPVPWGDVPLPQKVAPNTTPVDMEGNNAPQR